MGILQDLFKNIEMLFLSLHTLDYSKLILFLGTFILIYLIHFLFLNRKYKKQINKANVELKRINLEATLSTKKQNLFYFYFYSFLFVSFLYLMKDNLAIILPILSAVTIIFILSLKEQLNNIFLGILYKSSITTTIYEGMLFYFKEHPNDICKIVKVNLFKSIYKNERTGRLHSIENKNLNNENLMHKVLDDLDYVEFSYILKYDDDIEKYISKTKEKLDDYLSGINFNLSNLKNNIFQIKMKYNSAPYLKPFYDINLSYKSKDEIIVVISLTTYNYNYDDYLEDFLKYRPKDITK